MSDTQVTPTEQEGRRDKYRAFRNYMTNELGITRQDIEAWTKQSVADEIEKKLGQINIDAIVSATILKSVQDAMRGYSTTHILESLTKELASQLKIEVVAK